MKQPVVPLLILFPFFHLYETTVYTKCEKVPAYDYIPVLAFAGDQKLLKLKCDTTGASEDAFRWDYTKDYILRGFTENVYNPDSESNEHLKFSTGANSYLAFQRTLTVEDTGYYCCQTFLNVFGTYAYDTYARRVYAVLVLRWNNHPTLTVDPQGTVEEDTEVTLTCERQPGSKLQDVIVPQTRWTLPEGLPEPDSKYDEQYKYTAARRWTGQKFQCSLRYSLPEIDHTFDSKYAWGSVVGTTTTVEGTTSDMAVSVDLETTTGVPEDVKHAEEDDTTNNEPEQPETDTTVQGSSATKVASASVNVPPTSLALTTVSLLLPALWNL